jgi:hypothetical protein
MLLSHLSNDFVSHFRLVLCTNGPQACGFGYRDRVPVLGLQIEQGKPCLAANFPPETQVQKDRRSVNLLHSCRIRRVGCGSKIVRRDHPNERARKLIGDGQSDRDGGTGTFLGIW